MPELVKGMTMAQLRERLKAQREAALPDYKNDPRYLTASDARHYLGCSQKKIHQYGAKGELDLIRLSPRCTFVLAEQVIALASKLGRETQPASAVASYLSRAQAAALLRVHPETVPRMVIDGRLTDTKLMSGRRYYGRAEVERARQRLEYERRMSVWEVGEVTGLPAYAIWDLVGSNLFPRPNRDGRFRRSEVFAWWDTWCANQSPFADPHKNDYLARRMAYFRAQEERRVAELDACKRRQAAEAAALKKDLEERRLRRSQRK